MAPPQTVTPMPAEQSATLAEFARACRAATRSVSLYPPTHPSIQASLSRVIAAAGRLIAAGDMIVTVLPDTLLIDGRAPVKPDGAIVELAGLMHDRLIGTIRMQGAADAHDWHALLLLLARTPDELIAEGGIGRAWAAAGRGHFEIREIDYAEVLRERAGGDTAQWDAIIAYCLEGGAGAPDEQQLSAMLSMLGDPARFGELLERLQTIEGNGGATVNARVAALLTLVQKMLESTAHWPKPQGEDVVLQTAADAAMTLTPEMMLGLVRQAQAREQEPGQIAGAVVNRIKDDTIASFVANSIVKGRGASERLAQAFEALVPESDRKERLLSVAKDEAAQTPFGQETNFENLWQSAAQMLASYSDESYVSAEYARELSGARHHAMDVQRVSDDPPERLQRWLATISDAAVQELDLQLLLDLLQVEQQPQQWSDVARTAVSQIQQRLAAGEFQNAQTLAFAIVRETSGDGRESLRSSAESMLELLARGSFTRSLAVHLRRIDDADLEPLSRLCRTIGTTLIRPLTEVLVVEENARAIRRLRELLFSFGAAGRDSVERLKLSPNPAVRRTAIDLLRMFGGADALRELSSMLEDPDPLVQREAVRAIVQMGSAESFGVLQRALTSGGARGTILQELIALRDDRVVPLLCSVLASSSPRGAVLQTHTQIIEALGGLGEHPDSASTLRAILYGGHWWAPVRTATLRRAAATALRRMGTPASLAILEEAAKHGSRGVRNAARPLARMPGPRERQHI